ncbi:MAG TPA: helix-turn-helix transcriptional regulator [Candidatus Acidoferrales bacterium]|nr:helix-turn-helix transcriptional regulator [Candidatus Acidoferrales bacterium]
MAIRSLSPSAEFAGPELQPGTRLRRVRERLGLTFRDVERASYELACQRGRPEFIVHLSRLADIENRDVTPSIYKVYALAVIYHLDPKEVCHWYDVPFEGHFADGIQLCAPKTHLAAGPVKVRLPFRLDPAFDPRRTEFLTRMVERWGHLEGVFFNQPSRYLYGYVGVDDLRMHPLLRPGSLVLVDPKLRQVQNSGWMNEYERPVYFIELHGEFRCCWCQCENGKMILVPHPLSSCPPEVYRCPEEAEIVGQVVGVAMRLAPS